MSFLLIQRNGVYYIIQFVLYCFLFARLSYLDILLWSWRSMICDFAVRTRVMSVAPASVFVRELQFKHSCLVNCWIVAIEPILSETRFYLLQLCLSNCVFHVTRYVPTEPETPQISRVLGIGSSRWNSTCIIWSNVRWLACSLCGSLQ